VAVDKPDTGHCAALLTLQYESRRCTSRTRSGISVLKSHIVDKRQRKPCDCNVVGTDHCHLHDDPQRAPERAWHSRCRITRPAMRLHERCSPINHQYHLTFATSHRGVTAQRTGHRAPVGRTMEVAPPGECALRLAKSGKKRDFTGEKSYSLVEFAEIWTSRHRTRANGRL
jgi:hypothetical protein